jgi:hypothetical protein
MPEYARLQLGPPTNGLADVVDVLGMENRDPANLLGYRSQIPECTNRVRMENIWSEFGEERSGSSPDPRSPARWFAKAQDRGTFGFNLWG